MKYVYKKGENALISEKTKGHIKNSLKRKKRNAVNENTKHAPLLYNSNIKHVNEKREEELDLSLRTPGGFIKRDNLADFNIETVHVNTHQPSSSTLEDSDKYNKNGVNSHLLEHREIVGDSDESNEQNYKEDRYRNIDKKERVIPNNDYSANIKDEIEQKQYNKESEENNYYRNEKNKNRFTKHKDSSENTDDKFTRRQELKENDVSGEQYLRKQSSLSHGRNENLNIENNHSGEEKDQYTKKDKDTSTEEFHQTEPKSSEESIENDSVEIKQQYSQNKNKLNGHAASDNFNNSGAIQDVDLGNFSYESIDVNDKGQVIAAKDSHDNYYNDSDVKSNDKNKPFSRITNEHRENTHENINESNENSAENEKHININDGEVKPVIELNNEDSDEESDENSKEALNANLRENVDINTNTESNSQEIESHDDKTNVKQQFERIPPNYVHKDTKSNENEESDGTLDTISPKSDNFDEHLNIKFSDITIKLPEIKLPDDVLLYAKEEPDYENEKDKKENRYFHYEDSDEESEEHSEKPNSEKNKNDDQDEFYTPYFYGSNEELQNQHHKNTYDEANTDSEDLYEKFVRERFGKVKLSKKKSKKLQEIDKPTNPKLFEKIQKMLKKANDLQEEAEKSGDPKSGYLWTLEYGENL